MSISISPIGLASASVANQVSLLVTYKEKLCRPYCIDSTIQPQATVVYKVGTPVFNNTTVFIPITATITIVTKGCGCHATTQLYTENFEVAFQGQTAVPKAITLTNVGTSQGGSNITCGKAKSYTIFDSLTVKITPQAATSTVSEDVSE
jgi:hypothetical protein